MKREKLLIIVVIALFVLNLVSLGFLFSGNFIGAKKNGPGKPDKIIIDGLKLDQNQINQFNAIREGHHQKMMSIEKQEEKARVAFFESLKAEPIDTVQADSFIRFMSTCKLEKDQLTFEHFKELKAICRPDQIPLYNEVIDKVAKILMRGGPRGMHGQGQK